jgi:hypothetical protein
MNNTRKESIDADEEGTRPDNGATKRPGDTSNVQDDAEAPGFDGDDDDRPISP